VEDWGEVGGVELMGGGIWVYGFEEREVEGREEDRYLWKEELSFDVVTMDGGFTT